LEVDLSLLDQQFENQTSELSIANEEIERLLRSKRTYQNAMEAEFTRLETELSTQRSEGLQLRRSYLTLEESRNMTKSVCDPLKKANQQLMVMLETEKARNAQLQTSLTAERNDYAILQRNSLFVAQSLIKQTESIKVPVDKNPEEKNIQESQHGKQSSLSVNANSTIDQP
jgi:hypothetical protein